MTWTRLSRLTGVSPRFRLLAAHAGAHREVVQEWRDARKLGFEPFNANRCAGRGSAVSENAPDALEPGCHVALRAERLRLVVATTVQLVGEVLLRQDPRVAVVRIAVALAVPEPFGPGVVRIAQVDRDASEPAGAHVGDGL